VGGGRERKRGHWQLTEDRSIWKPEKKKAKEVGEQQNLRERIHKNPKKKKKTTKHHTNNPQQTKPTPKQPPKKTNKTKKNNKTKNPLHNPYLINCGRGRGPS